jgi:hypothetical protein
MSTFSLKFFLTVVNSAKRSAREIKNGTQINCPYLVNIPPDSFLNKSKDSSSNIILCFTLLIHIVKINFRSQ